MAGVQLPYGATLKFKYYLTNFFDEDFTENDGQGGTYKPYENVNVNIFYFSFELWPVKEYELLLQRRIEQLFFSLWLTF